MNSPRWPTKVRTLEAKARGQGQGQGLDLRGQGQGQGLEPRGQGQGQGHTFLSSRILEAKAWPRGLHHWFRSSSYSARRSTNGIQLRNSLCWSLCGSKNKLTRYDEAV